MQFRDRRGGSGKRRLEIPDSCSWGEGCEAGIPARENAVPGILSSNSKGGCGCREFYPAPAKGGGCCHHFSGGAPACRGRNRSWGSRRGAGGGDRAPPAPSRLLPPARPPAGEGFLSPARPAGSAEPRGGDGEEGPGAAGASCRRPRRGRAERGGSSARPGPAERRSRAEPNFPGGSDTHTHAHTYIDI